MERVITGYHLDEMGDWVAELACGHGQHLRHRPPFQLREWVLDPEGRSSRLATPLHCPWCDRAELPEGLRLVRSSPEWDEHTMPAGLRRAHRVAGGTWGRIVVRYGQLRFHASTEPALDVAVGTATTQAIPPEVEHEVELLGPVKFRIDFLSIPEHRPALSGAPASAGDPACWSHLLCPDCGTVRDRGGHQPGCRSGGSGGPAPVTAG